MTRVGLLANPVSGTDVRRIYSTAGFMDNMQKARILRGVLAGVEAAGVEEVLVMPDFYGIAAYAVAEYVKHGGDAEVQFLDMDPVGGPDDTIEAVRLMTSEGVKAIVLLGGDGTVRLASKVSGETPLMPISTGTNNVIPYHIDGTIAGLAAGAVAMGYSRSAVYRLKRIRVYVNGLLVDHALVDAAGTRYPFIASRALMDVNMVMDAVVAYAPPGAIGLASLASMIRPIRAQDSLGLYMRLGRKGRPFKAVLFPGIVSYVGVEEYRVLSIGDRVEFREPLTIELDGEREIMVSEGDIVEAEITFDGPLLIDPERALEELASGFRW